MAETKTPNEVYLRNIEDARQMTEEERFLAGLRMFDRASAIIKDGIRRENPLINDVQLMSELRRRLRIADRLANMGWYILDDLARADETPGPASELR